MNKIYYKKSTFFIILIWIILFIINKQINLISILGGKGLNNLNGEYYRFITAQMIHNDFVHLFANCLALYFIGYYLEKNIGSVKFLVFGMITSVLSELIFLSIYSKVDSSIGGSAITFAFIGLIVVLQFLKPEFPRLQIGTWYGNYIFIYGLVSNIPILSFMNITTVVIHLISFSVGALFGILVSYWGLKNKIM